MPSNCRMEPWVNCPFRHGNETVGFPHFENRLMVVTFITPTVFRRWARLKEGRLVFKSSKQPPIRKSYWPNWCTEDFYMKTRRTRFSGTQYFKTKTFQDHYWGFPVTNFQVSCPYCDGEKTARDRHSHVTISKHQEATPQESDSLMFFLQSWKFQLVMRTF